jgi:hypothetical protein
MGRLSWAAARGPRSNSEGSLVEVGAVHVCSSVGDPFFGTISLSSMVSWWTHGGGGRNGYLRHPLPRHTFILLGVLERGPG